MVAAVELQARFPSHVWRLVCVDASYEDVLLQKEAVWRVMQPCNTTMDFNIGAAFFFASRARGWLYQPPQQHLLQYDGRIVEGVPASKAPARQIARPAATTIEGADKVVVATASFEQKAGNPVPAVRDRDGAGASVGAEVGVQKAAKLNKNMAELCPVEGCRRLLKPGCTFGVCSRCCLKAQGFLDDAGSDSRAPTPPTVDAVAAAAVAAGEANEQQRLFKARAAAEVLRALEDHLTARFDLSTPFRAEALASLLRRDESTCPVRAGRDLHYRSRVPTSRKVDGGLRQERNSGGGARQSIKWCPVHKSRSRGLPDGGERSGGANSEAEARKIERKLVSGPTFTSSARVLLVGIGADEFMGGYSRHRNAYNRGGAAALSDEMVKDQGRLWTRNLGRDDRCIADHGREARFPFLDEGVVGYIRSLPLLDVCNMEEPVGVGDKKILREVAGHLGLDSCRTLPKRAIQFGSRIAQHCARHTLGSHRRGSGTDPALAVLGSS